MQSTLIKTNVSHPYCNLLCLPELACYVVCNFDACNYIKIFFHVQYEYICNFFVVDRSARKQKKREGKEAQACRGRKKRSKIEGGRLSRCHGDEQSDSDASPHPFSSTNAGASVYFRCHAY